MNFICVRSHLREFDTYLRIRVGRELTRLTRSGRRGADDIDEFHPFCPHLHRKPRADSSLAFVFGCASDKVVVKTTTTTRRGGESRSPRGWVGGGDVIGRDF
ncbi:unnamed protein product [Sphagnum balticum]